MLLFRTVIESFVLMTARLFLIFCVSDCRGDTKLSVFEGDIRDGDFLRKICRGASIVFHIASIIDVSDSVKYSELYGVNVKGKALCHCSPQVLMLPLIFHTAFTLIYCFMLLFTLHFH